MEKREHFFIELGRNVITVSDYMDSFEDYILCFKKNQIEEPNRMYYWCEKKEKDFNEAFLQFIIAGKEEMINGELIINLNILYNKTTPNPSSVTYNENEWFYEHYK